MYHIGDTYMCHVGRHIQAQIESIILDIESSYDYTCIIKDTSCTAVLDICVSCRVIHIREEFL